MLRLYVDQLWSMGDRALAITPERLRSIQPGLEGYFEDWWREQEALWRSQGTSVDASALWAVLATLGCAFGPLRRDDLARLAGLTRQLDGETLRRALTALSRFIVGDGDQVGYVFGHPRFAAYVFGQRLLPRDRQRWDRRFVTWGERVRDRLDRARRPTSPPEYLLRYHGAHLRRLGVAADRSVAMLTPAWCAAIEKLDGDPSGFLNEAQQLRDHIARGVPHR